MGWSGGVFSRVHDWTTDDGNGVAILSSRMDAEDDNFATGINNCLTKDGQNTPTGNLPMGTYRHTGVGAGAALTDYLRLDQLHDRNDIAYATAGGTANVLTLTLSPAVTAYAAGQVFHFKMLAGTNSGATTLNVNGLGAKAIQWNGSALQGYELVSGLVYCVVYDGTQFQLQTLQHSGAMHPSSAYMGMTGGQTIGSGSWTRVVMTTSATAGTQITATTGASSKLEPQVLGTYLISCTVVWNPTGVSGQSTRALKLYDAGVVDTTYAQTCYMDDNIISFQTATWIVDTGVAAGEAWCPYVFQNYGSNVTLTSCDFSVHKISDIQVS